MKPDLLVKFALKQAAITLAVLVAIPVSSTVALILTQALADLLCSQMYSLMLLSVVVTTSTLAVKQFRSKSA
ncbi:MAG: hypothetical protein K8I82_28980 [Anaerolineae bacterium]|nr:hypothetical protein [Anaerolineae bacterium]